MTQAMKRLALSAGLTALFCMAPSVLAEEWTYDSFTDEFTDEVIGTGAGVEIQAGGQIFTLVVTCKNHDTWRPESLSIGIGGTYINPTGGENFEDGETFEIPTRFDSDDPFRLSFVKDGRVLRLISSLILKPPPRSKASLDLQIARLQGSVFYLDDYIQDREDYEGLDLFKQIKKFKDEHFSYLSDEEFVSEYNGTLKTRAPRPAEQPQMRTPIDEEFVPQHNGMLKTRAPRPAEQPEMRTPIMDRILPEDLITHLNLIDNHMNRVKLLFIKRLAEKSQLRFKFPQSKESVVLKFPLSGAKSRLLNMAQTCNVPLFVTPEESVTYLNIEGMSYKDLADLPFTPNATDPLFLNMEGKPYKDLADMLSDETWNRRMAELKKEGD